MTAHRQDIDASTSYVNLERLTFLIDGVFAITLTLLVLELRPPEGDASELAEGLIAMLPRLSIYLLAFYTIANHWVAHQRTFRHITAMDSALMWLNLLGLPFITLIPAATAIIGRYPTEKLAVVFFSVNSLLHALTSWLFWVYVVKNHNRFTSESDPDILHITAQVWLMITVCWFISIFLGFLNVNLAYVSWVL